MDSLVYDLENLLTDPADKAAQAIRTRIHARFVGHHAEREKTAAELKALAPGRVRSMDLELLDELPELAANLGTCRRRGNPPQGERGSVLTRRRPGARPRR